MPTVLSTATIITHSHQSPLCEPRPGHQMLCEKHCYKYSSIKCISHHHCQNRFHAACFFSVISNLKSYLCASDWQSLGHMHVSLMQKQLKKQVSGLYSETLLIRKDIPKHMKRGKDVGKKYQDIKGTKDVRTSLWIPLECPHTGNWENGLYHLLSVHDLNLPASPPFFYYVLPTIHTGLYWPSKVQSFCSFRISAFQHPSAHNSTPPYVLFMADPMLCFQASI